MTLDDALWYRRAVIYQLPVKAFFDANHDGVGDFLGLTMKLDYLQDLGVTCLGLLPFYPSPLRADGYDVVEQQNVHPLYGTIGDFADFVEQAHARGIRVLIDIVFSHTSDQHPWFQRARQAPRGSPEREFYVWSDTEEVSPQLETSAAQDSQSRWTYDSTAGQYYWHRFYSFQPELNHSNPAVLEALIEIMKFWLRLGVDALRLDAVPSLPESRATTERNSPEAHQALKRIRRELDAQYSNRPLFAYTYRSPPDARHFFGAGDECQVLTHESLPAKLLMALRMEDRTPLVDALAATPVAEPAHWGLFLRDHNSLSLAHLTSGESAYMWQTFAADPLMRSERGIRRRTAPLLENNRERLELVFSILFSLPGTPILYYGDEIGMGDNVYLGADHGLRTPMQWTGDRNAGFSRAPNPSQLYAPVVADPNYGYASLNVEAQERVPFSFLNWMKHLILARKSHEVFAFGAFVPIPSTNRKVLAYVRARDDDAIVCVANLSRHTTVTQLDLSAFAGSHFPIELLGQSEFPPIGQDFYPLTLGPYGFYWLVLMPLPADDPRRVQFFSCFISYSTHDQEFATKLHKDLLERGVRCWFAPHDVTPGHKLHQEIDKAIRGYDRVLLILSPHSMQSEWVSTEIAKARQREMRGHRQVLFPICLTAYEEIQAWECFDADTGKDSAREIREYYIPDFSGWRDENKYQEVFRNLLKGLQSSSRSPADPHA